MIRLSRSQIEARQKCPTQEFWNYRHNGLGLQRVGLALPLANGIHTHNALALVLTGTPVVEAIERTITAYRAELMTRGVESVAPEHLAHLADEQSALLEGLVRGWARFRLPEVLDEFEVVEVEQEKEWPLPTLMALVPDPREDRVILSSEIVVQIRMDAVLRHKGTGELHILDFKTTSHAGKQWQEAFEHSLQTVLYVGAARHLYPGESIAGVFYEGLCTGGRRWAGKTSRWAGRKIQGSPLCYLYSDGTSFQKDYTPKKGWGQMAQWESGMAPLEWCERAVTEPVWRELFWHVPTLLPAQAEIDHELRQLLWEEMVQQNRLANLPAPEAPGYWEAVQVNVPKHRHQCRPWQGGTCPFFELCYEQGIGENPLASGVYEVRDPHHPQPEGDEGGDESTSTRAA